MRLEHEGKKPFICQLPDEEGGTCEAGFMTAGSLRSHQGRVHGDKRFWCSECSPEEAKQVESAEVEAVAFSTYAELKAHIASEHPPKCSECGLQCSSHRELNKHVEIRHGLLGLDERRTHICPEPCCGRGFTTPMNLNVHMQTIHGDKRFVCGAVDPSALNRFEGWDGSDACGTPFTSKRSLEEHIRTAHLGLESAHKQKRRKLGNYASDPFSRKRGTVTSILQITGAGYVNEAESGRHIPCLAPPCPRRFMRVRDLRLHLKIHHGASGAEIEALLGAVQGEHRPTLDRSAVFATAEDLEAERALDNMHGDAMEGLFQEGQSNGGEEQRMSVEGSGLGAGIDIEMIDPTLR